MLRNTNNSNKDQSFVYIRFNRQTLLFQIIQFSISNLFALGLNIKHFYVTLSGAIIPGQSGSGREHFTFSKLWGWILAIRLFTVISRTLIVEVLPLCRDAVGAFFSPSGLNQIHRYIRTYIHTYVLQIVKERKKEQW